MVPGFSGVNNGDIMTKEQILQDPRFNGIEKIPGFLNGD